jgi:phospholipid/cholesterol/gamma-HCH transport system substrate-binding protein
VEVKKEFKVGILVITALVILYFGIGFLKGSDIFNPARSYYVAYENVDGLTASNPIMLDGFQVGLVKRIKIFQGRKKPVVVELEINKDIVVGDSAKALLSNNGLLGGKMIILDPGSRMKALEGDTLIASVAPGFTSMLEDKAQPMVDKVTALVNSVDGLIHSFEPTVGKMNESLEAITKLSNTSNAVMADSKQDIAHITQNLDKLSKSLLDAEKQLELIMTKVGKLGDSLNKADLAGTIHSLHRTTDQLNKTMVALNQGQGTMGKLLKSDSLYRNLNASSASLNALLIDFKANPKRYVHFSVFGSKDKKSSSGSSK